jgi:hypothetical protein
MSYHVFRNKYGDKRFAIVYGKRQPDHIRNNRGATGPRLNDAPVTLALLLQHLLQQVVVKKIAFFQRTGHLFSPLPVMPVNGFQPQ